VVAVEFADDLDQRADRLEVARVDGGVGEAHGLGEAGDLQMDVAVRRVEPAVGERPVHLAPHGARADLPEVRDLLDGPARRDRLEHNLPPGGLRLPQRLGRRALFRARGRFVCLSHRTPHRLVFVMALYISSDFSEHFVAMVV
jgi:hypothetical protein